MQRVYKVHQKKKGGPGPPGHVSKEKGGGVAIGHVVFTSPLWKKRRGPDLLSKCTAAHSGERERGGYGVFCL